MIGIYILIAFGALAYFLKRPRKEFKLGQHLTRMTTIFEDIERTRHTMPIGAGGGIDSLSPARRLQAETQFEQSIAYLRSFPRHEITRELIKNAILNQRLGRPLRVIAIDRLMGVLIGEGVALNMDEFDKSYG